MHLWHLRKKREIEECPKNGKRAHNQRIPDFSIFRKCFLHVIYEVKGVTLIEVRGLYVVCFDATMSTQRVYKNPKNHLPQMFCSKLRTILGCIIHCSFNFSPLFL